jgi:hypothetical protein
MRGWPLTVGIIDRLVVGMWWVLLAVPGRFSGHSEGGVEHCLL